MSTAVFLDAPERFHVKYTKNGFVTNWEDLKGLTAYFPELESRAGGKKSLIFWKNLEEREAVIGNRCSELTLRLCEAKKNKPLPIRYLYQDLNSVFTESLQTILKIINAVDSAILGPHLDIENLKNRINDQSVRKFFDQTLFSRIVSTEGMLDDSIYSMFFSKL